MWNVLNACCKNSKMFFLTVNWILIAASLMGVVNADEYTYSYANVTDQANARAGKFIFTMIRFPNTGCGSGLNMGTCFTSTECTDKGGTSVSTCAKGYGTCCKITSSSCGGEIRTNNTWVQNAEYPGSFNEARSCTWQVYFDDTAGRICQIRYDFFDHRLAGPDTMGRCLNDQMVFNEDRKSTYFCGIAPSNYHWLVETAGTTSPHTFSINTDATSFDRRYAMKVSFIPCKLMIPTKCGQYYEGTSGTINSYNYNQNSYYLAGLMYAICFRKETGRCTYTLSKTSDNQFIHENDLLRLMMGNGIPVLPNPAIPGSTFLCPLTSSQESHMYFTSGICNYPPSMTSIQMEGPFFVNVVTGINDGMDNFNTLPFVSPAILSGFEFDWASNAC